MSIIDQWTFELHIHSVPMYMISQRIFLILTIIKRFWDFKTSYIVLQNFYLSAQYMYMYKQSDNVNFLYRDVYDKLVENGTIVPEPEQPPPTVPMDYTWARVSWFICSSTDLHWFPPTGTH